MPSLTHGASRGGKTTPTYNSWKLMKARCLSKSNRSYHHYGGRGISICKRWMKFENFIADMGEKPFGRSIDRIDNNGNYTPKNCRWSTQLIQMSNTRRSVYLTFRGRRQHVSAWARELGCNSWSITLRIRGGWSVEKTLTTPFGRWEWDDKKILLQFKGKMRGIREISKLSGIGVTTLHYRVKAKWPLDRIFNKKSSNAPV